MTESPTSIRLSKTNGPRVRALAADLGIPVTAAINLLIAEALNARATDKERKSRR